MLSDSELHSMADVWARQNTSSEPYYYDPDDLILFGIDAYCAGYRAQADES